MSPELLGLILIVVLFALLLLGVNVAVALATIGLVGVTILTSMRSGLGMIQVVPFTTVANFAFIALPLFILMGEFAFNAGITRDLFNAGYKWLGHLPGGMAMGVMAAGAGFGAISGSTLVSAAAMTRASWPELMKFNYDKGLSAGTVASAGCLAVLIPPSIMAVIYGMFTQTPIGPILMGGVIPGIITTVLFMSVIFIRAVMNPNLAPKGPRANWKERFGTFKHMWATVALILLVTGGIYAGIFTPTEAAAAGALGAFIIALLTRSLNWAIFRSSMLSTLKTSSFIFLIMVGAFLFSRLLALSKVSALVGGFVGGLEVNRVIILIGILLLYVGLGMLLDTVSMLAVSISTTFPIIIGLGFDPVWFGIVIVMMCEIAAVTPPVGLNVFADKAVLGDEIQTWTIYKSCIPFLAAHVTLMALIIAFPQIVLWLPSKMAG
ncbi:MAG: TRAP transporter large permease subunit [Chloroflexi bacterium]|nr:TRAP transporter large permease subunit [Chloroflexota bacterium]